MYFVLIEMCWCVCIFKLLLGHFSYLWANIVIFIFPLELPTFVQVFTFIDRILFLKIDEISREVTLLNPNFFP